MTVYPERAEVHILDDEAAARAYIEQMWAEAMTVYRSGKYKLSFSMEMIPERPPAGLYAGRHTGRRSTPIWRTTRRQGMFKQLYEEALGT
ncbi:MAG: hypothetical protein ACLRNW_12495 [Neglectibacter sp.]